MLDTGDLHGSNSGAGQRRQQDAAQGVAQSGAVATLQGLDYILAVIAVVGVLNTLNAGLFDFYH